MFTSCYTWLQHSKHTQILKFFLLCLAIGLLLWGLLALVHSSSTTQNGPTLQIATGFDGSGTYRSDYWTPVHITLSNDGAAFKGTLAVRAYSDPSLTGYSDATSTWSFASPITLPKGSNKEITLNAPHFLSPYSAHGFVATLKDEQGQVVLSKFSQVETEVKPGDLLIGVLGDSLSGFSMLQHVQLQGQANSPAVVQLDASQMPTTEQMLESFDIIILENFPTDTLTTTQISTLQNWVNRGGILIEVGGVHWQRTLSPLPTTLLPVQISGLSLLPPGGNILPTHGTTPVQPDQAPHPTDAPLTTSLIVSTATARHLNTFSSVETIIENQDNALMVKAHQGAGTIFYLGIDPAALPLSQWTGTQNQLWPALLVQTLGDKLLIPDTAMGYDSGPGQILARGGILSLLIPSLPQGPWMIAIFLLIYILILGPLSLLLIRRVKQPRLWRWRVLVSCIVLFSILAFAFSGIQKSSALTNTTISLIQINQGGSGAHVTTYMGVSTPGEGDFNVHIPGENLTQPISNHFLQKNSAVAASSDIPTTITTSNNGTDMTLQNQHAWSMNPVITEQDSQLPGTISTHLTLENNRLVGTITNTLNTALSDLYVLFPHTFVPIKHIAAGATIKVNSLLYSSPGGSGKTLADQIATYNKLGNAYFPYNQKKQPQNTVQKHVALLSALSGNGYSYDPCDGSCLTHGIMTRGVIYTTGGQVPNPNLKNDYDPLLISGSPATLIGWTDHPVAGIPTPTVNGSSSTGQQTSLIQMPVTLQFSGLVQVPQDFLPGSVIDIQSDDAQASLPGVYTLDQGQVTFELPITNSQPIQIQSLIVNVPDLIAHPSGPGSGSAAYHSNVQVQFYNWQSSSWEQPVQLTQGSFTLNDMATYAGPTGRVLVEVEAIDQNKLIYFGKPSLQLNAVA